MTPPSPVQALLWRWFVQYNPLFTASALCVLGGVFGLSGALGEDGDVTLTAVLEVYQWLLIGGGALLYRRLLRRRSGAILGIIAVVYLADPTLQLPSMASSGHAWGNAVWLLLLVAKLLALRWAFCLTAPPGVMVAAVLGGATLAVLPVVRLWTVGPDASVLAAALAGWTLVLGLLLRNVAWVLHSAVALGDFGRVAFARIQVALVGLYGAALAYHAWNVAWSAGVRTLWPSLAVAVLLTVRSTTNPGAVWVRLGLALLVLTWAPHGVAQGALQGLVLVLASVMLALDSARVPHFAAAVVVMLFVAARLAWLRTVGAGAEPWEPAVLASVVAGLALWRRRIWSVLPALVVVWGPTVARLELWRSAPAPGLWGAVLVVLGFGLLVAGVVLHGLLGAGEDRVASALVTTSETAQATSAAALAHQDVPPVC